MCSAAAAAEDDVGGGGSGGDSICSTPTSPPPNRCNDAANAIEREKVCAPTRKTIHLHLLIGFT